MLTALLDGRALSASELAYAGGVAPQTASDLGAALAARSFELGWIARIRDTRAVLVTDNGKRGFSETFGIELAA